MSQASEIFARALELRASRRDEFVRRCTRRDPRLRIEVDSLLRSYSSMGNFLDTESSNEIPPRHTSSAEPDRDAVAGHELLRKIGEGGFGTVHLAHERGTLQRQVAIKFLKRDLLSTGALERFESERQILANLQHDSIARIFTAGTANAGCPYYTMEFVDGPPLDAFCDSGRLTIAARVELFLRVCRAVAHAHQRGVIHGDIKPRNVLVCSVDGEPSPKVIDFGIARSLGEPAARSSSNAGTPRYMSPEQRSGAPADTRADVFALGVLLHELLIGPTARDASDSSTQTTLRVREDAEVELLAAARASSPRQLRRELRGDLDHIVRSATRTDPEQRYGTARELIADAEAWQQGRPLPSRPRAPLYVLKKFVGRHRLAVAALGLLVVGGAALGARSWHLARLAEDARVESKAAQRRANEWGAAADNVLEFLDRVFLEASPGRSGPNVTLLSVVDTAEQRFDTDPPDVPLVASRLARILGHLRTRLEQPDRAESLFRRAVQALERSSDSDARAIASARLELAELIGRRQHTEESRTLLEQALGDFDPAADFLETIRARRALALVALHEGRPQEMLRGFRSCYRDAVARLGTDHPLARQTALVLAEAERNYGDLEAGRQLRASLGDVRDLPPSTGFYSNLYAKLVEARARYDEADYATAEKLAQEVLDTLEERSIPRTSTDAMGALNVLAGIAQRRGDLRRAVDLSHQIFTLRSERHGPKAVPALRAAGSFALMLMNLRRFEDAREFLDEHAPLEIVEQHEDPGLLALLRAHASLLQRERKAEPAHTLRDRILARNREHYGEHHPNTLDARRRRAQTIAIFGAYDDALSELESVRKLCVEHFGPAHFQTLDTLGLIARTLSGAKRLDEAEDQLESRLSIALAAHGPSHGTVRIALRDIRQFARAVRRPALLERARAKTQSAFEESMAAGEPSPALLAAWEAFRGDR